MNTAHPGPYAAIPRWQRPITRRPGEVQFGVLEGGPIVSGVTPDEARLLARLDGTMPPDALDLVARSSGVSKRRWRVLLDLVMRLGLLEPEPAPRARTVVTPSEQAVAGGADVLVDGDGALAEDLRQLLGRDAGAASGGAVGASGASGASGARGVGGARSVGRVHPARESPPGVVVLVADIALDPRRGDLWLQRGIAHLPVVTTGGRAVVGPLVDGSCASPCLWCLDLHRTDRDPAWPTVMAQVANLPVLPVEPVEPVEPLERVAPMGQLEPGESARPLPSVERGAAAARPLGGPNPSLSDESGLTQLVAGTVAALVARTLAGDRPPSGVAVEVSVPWPRIDHRRWRPHPRCRHHRPPPEPGPP